MADNIIYYPSQNFIHSFIQACNKGEDFIVTIPLGWRKKIIEKKIDTWPTSSVQFKETKENRRKTKNLPYLMILYPSLMSNHFSAINNGYIMSYEKSKEFLKILYKYHHKSNLQPGRAA